MDALRNFFTVKFPEYADNVFYIAGESYAGKMIPDLAMKILGYNSNSPPKQIKLKGILMANPVLTFEQLQ
jgi:carboxypeptidase C (cathepsin A)